ncbi:type II secretion system protein GspM [Rhizobium sp. BK491]|uniref:type II secretion system protein GspM n=1 Tax=Rhizobium sp. BK491 TaxID=2587009 RepID=UPI00161FBB05|nr:type II secretion system protein GspM [Rhizobium sp. BK491]MBB3571271.1 hypothetical protein [Rhizobium sp. BK491]
MTDLLIRIMNLPTVVQKALALLVLLVVFLIPVCLAVIGIGMIADVRVDIDDGKITLARVERLLAVKQSANIDEPNQQKMRAELSASFLQGTGLSAIQAELQARVNAIAGANIVDVPSIGGTTTVSVDGVQLVGVRATLQGALPAIQATLLALETSSPPLIIREASMRSMTPIQENGLTAPISLAADIAVYGVADPKLELKDSGQ